MKRTKAIAAVILSVALGATAFAACGGGKTTSEAGDFDVTNYAHALDSAYAENHLYTGSSSGNAAKATMVKKNYLGLEALYNGFCKATVKGTAGNTYTLYDAVNDKELFTGATSITAKSASASGTYVAFYVLGTQSGENTVYRIVGPDGKSIVDGLKLNSTSYVWVNSDSSSTVNGETRYQFLLQYTHIKGTDEVTETKYFNFKINGDSVEDFKEGKISVYEAGDSLGLVRTSLADEKDYPNAKNLVDYEYTVEGAIEKTYTFYKGNTATGSITLGSNSSVLGYIGDYMLYFDTLPVSADATSGYNLEVVSSYGSIKSNVELYRYNYASGAEKAEKLDVDYVPFYMGSSSSSTLIGTTMYNYSTNTFDCLMLPAGALKDGVCVTNGIQNKGIVIGEDGKMIADISGTLYNGQSMPIYKLNDTNFIAFPDGYNTYVSIVDKNLKTVAQLGASASIIKGQQLIDTNLGQRIAVDFSGEVAFILPSNNSYAFYGAAAVTSTTVYSAKYPQGKLLSEIYDDFDRVASGAIITKKQNSTDNNYVYNVYDLDGKKIGNSITTTNYNLSWNSVAGGKIVFANVTEGENQVVYIVK